MKIIRKEFHWKLYIVWGYSVQRASINYNRFGSTNQWIAGEKKGKTRDTQYIAYQVCNLCYEHWNWEDERNLIEKRFLNKTNTRGESTSTTVQCKSYFSIASPTVSNEWDSEKKKKYPFWVLTCILMLFEIRLCVVQYLMQCMRVYFKPCFLPATSVLFYLNFLPRLFVFYVIGNTSDAVCVMFVSVCACIFYWYCSYFTAMCTLSAKKRCLHGLVLFRGT